MNQMQLMAQMKKMQAEMTRAQEELASTTVSGIAAGDAVRVEMTCDHHVRSVKISAEAIDPADPETLEDLIVVATNDALRKIEDTAQKRMGSVTGGLRIPGMT